MAEVRFEFQLQSGHGWASGALTIGAAKAHGGASYVSDALGDFIGVVNQLVWFEHPQLGMIRSCVWDDEPAGTLWEVELFADRLVEVRVYQLNDAGRDSRIGQLTTDDPSKLSRLIIKEKCSLLDLGRAVAAGAQRALLGWGLEKWRGRWGHEFPIGAYFTLVQGLDALEGRPAREMTIAAELETLRDVMKRAEQA